METLQPESPAELAASLYDAAAHGRIIRLGGAFTKDRMAGPAAPSDVTISTAGLTKVLEYEPGDLTISVEAYADLRCGSAGIYNVVHDEMAASILEKKMTYANSVQPDVITTANPGCMIQLQARVELLDEAYGEVPEA